MPGVDRILGLALLLASLVTLDGARGLELTRRGTGFGPGMFPVVIAMGLLLCALLLILSPAHGRPAKANGTSGSSLLRAPGVWTITAGFLAVVEYVGFLPASVLLTFAVTWLFGEKRLWMRLVYAIVVGVAAKLLFTRWLNVMLPTGILDW